MRLHVTIPPDIAKAVRQGTLFGDSLFDHENGGQTQRRKGNPDYRQEVRHVNPKDARPHTRRVWVRAGEKPDEGKGAREEADQPDVERWKVDNPAARDPNDRHARRWLRENPTSITAFFDGQADPREVAQLPGAKREHENIDAARVKRLADRMRREGYRQDHEIMVQVMADGRALLWEGNHRVRAAIEAGLDRVPLRVNYEGGSEQIEGVWMPSTLHDHLDESEPEPPAEAPTEEPQDERYKDVGEKIGGARKDLATLRAKYHEGAEVDLSDLDVLEADPEAAHQFVTRDRQFGGTRREVAERHRANGMDSRLAYVADRVLANIDQRPDDTPEARRAFIKAAERIEGMFASWVQEQPLPSFAIDALKDLRNSMIGYDYAPSEANIRDELRRHRDGLWDDITRIYQKRYYDLGGRRQANKGFWQLPEVVALSKQRDDVRVELDQLRDAVVQRSIDEPNSPRNVLLGLGPKFWKWIGARQKLRGSERTAPWMRVETTDTDDKRFKRNMQTLRDRVLDDDVRDWTWLDGKGGAKKQRKRQRPEWERQVPDEAIREGGEDATFTDEGFRDAFSLRGVEYGNWMSQDDRREHTQAAGEALLDLAAILGVEPGDVSLNGRLAIAFGARGHGGRAAAHYERDKKAINLTKYAGGGTLAHEWGHALDNVMALVSADGQAYHHSFVSDSDWQPPGEHATDRVKRAWEGVRNAIHHGAGEPYVVHEKPSPYGPARHGVRGESAADRAPDLAEAHQAGSDVQAIPQQEALTAARALDAERAPSFKYAKLRNEIAQRARLAVDITGSEIEVAIPRHPKTSGESDFAATARKMGAYWQRPHELFARAFETFVHDEMQVHGMRNTYLVAGVDEAHAASWGDSADILPHRKTSPYPRGEERRRVNDAMRELTAALREDDWFAKAIDLLDALYGPAA